MATVLDIHPNLYVKRHNWVKTSSPTSRPIEISKLYKCEIGIKSPINPEEFIPELEHRLHAGLKERNPDCDVTISIK